MSESLVHLLSRKLGVPADDNLRESVHYILSIPDDDDLREWLEEGMGLTDTADQEDIVSAIKALKSSPVVTDTAKKIEPRKNVVPVGNTADIYYPMDVPNSPPRQARRPLPPVPTSTKESSRSMCHCLAKSEYPGGHRVIGNCLRCGRVVCAEEDFGDCLYCGESKTGAMYWIGYALTESIESPAKSSSAVEQKDRLIQYDREGTRRTRIYDDSTDWFAETQDVWRGKEEREEAKKLMEEFEDKKSEARRRMKISLDFNSGAISVLDKEGEMRKVEQQRDEQLHAFVSRGELSAPSSGGNVLNEEQEKILREIREKLGVKEKHEPEKVYTSLFSVFEDLG